MPARPARRGSVSGAPCRRLVTARDGTACLEKRAGCGPGRGRRRTGATDKGGRLRTS